MTPRRTRHHQPLPNRRFRRLLPTAVLAATLAASSAGPAAARADAQRAGHRSPPPARVLPADVQAPPTAHR
jgi:hypothetical protein